MLKYINFLIRYFRVLSVPLNIVILLPRASRSRSLKVVVLVVLVVVLLLVLETTVQKRFYLAILYNLLSILLQMAH